MPLNEILGSALQSTLCPTQRVRETLSQYPLYASQGLQKGMLEPSLVQLAMS